MAPPRKRALPKPLPDGFILVDSEKKKWRLGKILGEGGFGLIYLASQDVSTPVKADADYVIKVEYHENGPLFSELKFYQRAAKPESMQKWKRGKKMDFLGIPTYWGSGLAEYKDLRYRFMAMDRLGCDLQKVCERNRGRLKKATVLQLGQRLVDVLEYIHENEYVHADIKAANLMLGYGDPENVYLADYGLSYRYCPDGVHKEYKENPKKGHNGTIEYTSLDAHKGVAPSRRGDLQILGFCLLHWLCGSLPWDNVLKNPSQVQAAKTRLMDNLPGSVQQLSASGTSTDELAEFLIYVRALDYEDKPDYQLLKELLTCDVTGELDFSVPKGQEFTTNKPVKRDEKGAAATRGTSRAKLVTPKLDDEEPESAKSKPVPPRFIRGPPLTKSDSKENKKVSPGGAYSLRPRSACTYKEKEDSEEEEEGEEEEKDIRPKRIPACYLRGPPIGPGARPKQRAKSKRPNSKTEDELTRDVARRGHQHNRHMGRNGGAQCERERQTHGDYRERWDGRPHLYGVGDNQICSEHRDSFGEWEDSDPRDPRPEPPSLERNFWRSRFFCVGIILLLCVVFVFAKVHLNRKSYIF